MFIITQLIGLVVIVVLLTLGMLFMAKFSLNEDTKKKVFVRQFLATSAMGSLMKMNVNCEYYDVYGNFKKEPIFVEEELLEDCGVSKNSNSQYQCQGKHSCDFLNETLSSLLNQTLGKWNKHYEFKSTLIQGEKEYLLINFYDEDNQGCRLGDVDSSGIFPLNTAAGSVISILYLCD